MAANGIQFSEPQMNAMYQQQMITQQAYQQWMMALSPSQRLHLQHRMQACMQEVQQHMSKMMQHNRTETRAEVLILSYLFCINAMHIHRVQNRRPHPINFYKRV